MVKFRMSEMSWADIQEALGAGLSTVVFAVGAREGRYTKKQRRAFQRLMSGLTVGKSRRERLRFMTLTSSPEAKRRNLNADFRALKMRILRKYHARELAR